MSALKQLSAVYMVAASAFSIAILLAHHPDLAKSARKAANSAQKTTVALASDFESNVLTPSYGYVRDQGHRAWRKLAQAYTGKPAAPVPKAAAKPPVVTPVAPHSIILKSPPVRPRLAALPSRPATPHVAAAASAAPKNHVKLNLAPPPPAADLPPVDHPPSAAELARVEQRLKDNLTPELLTNFDLFLYVSKADKGPLAQRMYVFARNGNDLVLRYDWPASTGREKEEVSASGHHVITDTPRGYFELDPHRMYSRYTSHQWHQPMPHAMFFNWVHDGLETGLAIHAAHGTDISLLGRRASAGCIHLSPQNAATLFHLIRDNYKGKVPRFAFNRRTDTMANDGLLMHDAHGKLRYAEGYKVLIFIENYGGQNVVAMLM